MANNYLIDYTDPLSGTFSIPDAGFNGPGGKETNTTLRLYGRGAPQWGESVDENFVKLLEHFMSATEPLSPTPGQFWIKTSLYFKDAAADSGNGVFYSYNVRTRAWTQISFTTAATAPLSPASGQYWFDTATSTLKQYFQAYKQQTAAWHIRSFMTGTGNPQGVVIPSQNLMMWDVSSPNWVQAPFTLNSNSSAAPANNRGGTLRFDTDTGQMYFWDSLTTAWRVLAVGAINPGIFGDLDMGGFKIVNLGAAVNTGDAINLGFADARYVKKAGDSMTGQLSLSAGAPTDPLHAANKAYVDTKSVAAADAAVAALITFPPGGIIMWSGAQAAIPTGWVLCNGQNGTPDLRDRFVMGAGLTYAVGASGGSKDAIVPTHTHTLSGATTTVAGSHTHPVYDPGHTHVYLNAAAGQNIGPQANANHNTGGYSDTAAAGTNISLYYAGDHSHGLTGTIGAAGVSATNANLPPYYALCFIMKT